MKNSYLLIHGAWQGAWVWKEVADILRAAGHRTETMDLPGCGADTTPPADVTLASYAQAIIRKAYSMDCEKLILVGHSMGGAAITEAASSAPELFDRLIYVCAMLPETGQSVAMLSEISERYNPHGPQPLPTKDGRSMLPTAENIAATLFNGCDEAIIARVVPQFRPQAIGPLKDPVTRSASFEHLPKRYIRTLDDFTIAPQLQQEMAKAAGISDIREMRCCHEPFFAAPQTLARHLLAGPAPAMPPC